MDGVYVGDAGHDAALDRGRPLGHIRDPGDARHSEDVEIEWGVRPPGDERAAWVTGGDRTAPLVLVLVSGGFRVEPPRRSVLLAEQGGEGLSGGSGWIRERRLVRCGARRRSVPIVGFTGAVRQRRPVPCQASRARHDPPDRPCVVRGRGTDHSWYAEERSGVPTVRRPSVPGHRIDDE